MQFSDVIDGLVNLVFPQMCHACGRTVESLRFGVACRDCWEATPLFKGDEALCPKCGRMLRVSGGPAVGRCHRCDDHFYDVAVSCGMYERALAFSVLKLKSEPHLPAMLEELLTVRARSTGVDEADVLIPVPLSRRRRKERGFNQAEIIARSLSRNLRIPVDTNILSRSTDTPMHRATMDEKARSATVRSAFEAAATDAAAECHALLVDDVMTSGSTVSFCAKELKKVGVGRVSVITVARA